MVDEVVKTAKTWREYLKESPYFQPHSPIWCMGLVSVLAGIAKGLALTFPQLAWLAVLVDAFSAESMSPGMLISVGLSIMGLKANVDKK